METTPTTDQVRAIFAGNGDWTHTGTALEREIEFDRWLAQRDAELGIESPALVLKDGDVIILRHKNRAFTADEVERIREPFRRLGIGAIIVGPDWHVEREGRCGHECGSNGGD